MIAEKIDKIVMARKYKLEKVECAKAGLIQVRDAVKRIEVLQRRVNEAGEGDLLAAMLKEQPGVYANILQLDTSNFYRAYQNYLEELKKIENRFSRDTLNISFVGAAGQGKSCVLQKISGLAGDVIPSAAGSDCTGAKSIISNVSDSAEVTAEITFYSEAEIIDIVNGYLTEITGGNSYNVRALNKVSEIPIEVIEEQVRFSADAKGKLKQLRKYVEHLAEVSDNIGQTKIICKNDIEKYVAQHSCIDDAIQYYDYLCVKCADIRCQFPKKDAGRIVLVDTKGLGDTAMKVDENMLYAAENDSDAIILMYRPDALRAGLRQQEIDIIQKIADKITPQYCEQLLFWVVNRVKGGEGNNLAVIDNAKAEIVNSKMPVAGVLDVDCGDAVEVERKLLEPVLSGLTERIEAVDEMIIGRLNEKASSLIEEFQKITDRLENVFIGCVGEDVKRTLNSKIQGTRDRMLDVLRDLFHDLNQYRKVPCEEFKEASEQKLRNLLLLVPTQDKVVTLLRKGTAIHTNVYEECTHIIRMAIIDDFLELDDTLCSIVDTLKDRIIKILVEEGKLGLLIPYDGDTPDVWLETFRTKISADGNRYPLISEAIRKLEEFHISVEGFLIYEVRDKLDALDPSLHAQNPQIKGGGENKEEQAKDIIFWLDKYLSDVHDELRKSLLDFYKVPNRALFAATKDFYDRLAFSQEDTYNTVKEQWRYLYEQWIPVIWKKEYESSINGIEACKEWDEIVKSVRENACVEKLMIK